MFRSQDRKEDEKQDKLKRRSTLTSWRRKIISPEPSPVMSPQLSPRPDGEADMVGMGIPKSKSMNALAEELKQAQERESSRALASGGWTAPPPTRALRKKHSLADIFFMSSPLHGAAKRGDIDDIQKQCQVRRQALGDVDFTAWLNGNANKNKQTALHVSIQHNFVSEAKTLCRLGCQSSAQDVNGRSCMLYCARYGHLELLRFFLRRSDLATLEKDLDFHGDGVLHLAATHGHTDVINYLLVRKGFDVNVQNQFQETPLHKAARTDNEEMVALLLSLNASIDIIGRDGKPKHVTQNAAILKMLRQAKSKSGMIKSKPMAVSNSDRLRKQSLGIEGDPESDSYASELDGMSVTPSSVGDDVIGRLILRTSSPAVGSSSPTSEQVHFKLRRAMQKSSGAAFSLSFGERGVSEEVLRTRHELFRQTAEFAVTPRTRMSVLADPIPESGVVVETALARGSLIGSASITYEFEAFRQMYGKKHLNYICRDFGSHSGPINVVISVLSTVEDGHFPGLLRYSNGYAFYNIPESKVRNLMKQETLLPLHEAIRVYLEQNAFSTDACVNVAMPNKAAALLKEPAKLQRESSAGKQSRGSVLFPSLRKPVLEKLWHQVDDVALDMELLALELRLGLAKTLSVGVVRMLPGQTESEAQENPMSSAFESFLAELGNPIETLGWSGYSGGVSTKQPGKVYYASHKSIEIVFHACPLLSQEQRRQFIGNDKVLIYFLDAWRPGSLLEPKFRGNVNTVCVTARLESRTQYQFQSYHRIGMGDVKPALPEELVEFNSDFKHYLLAKLINAHVDSYNLLYADRMRRAWDEELLKLAEKYVPSKKLARK